MLQGRVDTTVFPFNNYEIGFIAAYVSSLLVIGWLGMRARREKSMSDFYLAGRGVGIAVLLLTLYATQYSGNTLFGFTGKTYRIGYSWTVCVHFMTAIVVFYLLFAPKLFQLSRRHAFITPVDFLQYRYESSPLNLSASIIMIIGLSNYLVGQLKALGTAAEGFIPSHPATAYVGGVLTLALIIVVYESLGGFRAVAWTDVIQGSVLLVGFAVLIVLVFQKFGSLSEATRTLIAQRPEQVAAPDANGAREWVSWILIVGLGGALYPQAIQRIYAAQSATVLRRSLAIMAFLPLTTTLIAVVFGVMASANLPGAASGDEILTVVCRQIQAESLLGRWLVVLLFAGILAALMSTADSVLLSISSMFAKDIYAVHIAPGASEEQLTRAGKICSWLVIATMAGAAIALREMALVSLLKIKFELLVQLAPAFILGIHWSRMNARAVLGGMWVGAAIAVGMFLTIPGGKYAGIHAGIYGLAANLLIAIGGSLIAREPEER